MPTRWIVFKVINYLIILVLVLQAIMILIRIEQTGSYDLLFGSLYFGIVGILLMNSIFNIIWLERYYSEQIPSTLFKRCSLIFFILAILAQSLLFIILSFLYFEFLLGEESLQRMELVGILLFLLLNFISLSGIYIIIYRFLLIRLIRQNQHRQFTDFLETQN